ncbi:Nitrogen starvation-induced glutamine rich protein [Balamuthia mandrillaris]
MQGQQGQQGLEPGAHVGYKLGQNILPGTIEEKLTEPHKVGGRVAHASESDPRYAVRDEHTGTTQIRRGETLVPGFQEGQGQQQGGLGGGQQQGYGGQQQGYGGGQQQGGEFKEGEHVGYKLGQNILPGTIEEKLTEPHQVGGRMAHASQSDPRYAVKDEHTGTTQIRRGETLTHQEQAGGGTRG